MAKQVSFKVERSESRIIEKIAARAVTLAASIDIDLSKVEVMMDLAATHANGCPLRLAALLTADDFNFSHDVFGIRRHLDRETGELGDCFLPRFARPETVAA